METIKVPSDAFSLKKMRYAALLYGSVSCVFYIIFLVAMKLAGLLHVTELRFVNYVILTFVGLFEIRRWIINRRAFVPFLQVFATVFFTGMWSFLLFSFFIYLYSFYDAELNELFVQSTMGYFQQMPSIVIFFEGSAASIIVAFINMQYYRRYEEGEKAIPK
jgi:hypothetical protein